MNYIGVDACKAGWIAIIKRNKEFFSEVGKEISELLDPHLKNSVITVDIPIGLLDHAKRGGRVCDKKAREMLGERGCCVFSPPVRKALCCETYPEASRVNAESSQEKIGISKQSYNLFPKILQIDKYMTRRLQKDIKEIHPELCFCKLNGGKPLTQKKKSGKGKAVRRSLLEAEGFLKVIEASCSKYLRKDVGMDDILDACVACWMAERIACHKSGPLSGNTEDSKGLAMEIWC